jgi:MFS family permease
MTSSVFLPSIPEMSVDLNTTAAVINYTVSPLASLSSTPSPAGLSRPPSPTQFDAPPQPTDPLQVCIFIATIGIAPLIWSPLSGFYGRRPVYLASMPIMVVSSIGVALSRTVGQIIATRILQGIGGSGEYGEFDRVRVRR